MFDSPRGLPPASISPVVAPNNSWAPLPITVDEARDEQRWLQQRVAAVEQCIAVFLGDQHTPSGIPAPRNAVAGTPDPLVAPNGSHVCLPTTLTAAYRELQWLRCRIVAIEHRVAFLGSTGVTVPALRR